MGATPCVCGGGWGGWGGRLERGEEDGNGVGGGQDGEEVGRRRGRKNQEAVLRSWEKQLTAHMGPEIVGATPCVCVGGGGGGWRGRGRMERGWGGQGWRGGWEAVQSEEPGGGTAQSGEAAHGSHGAEMWVLPPVCVGVGWGWGGGGRLERGRRMEGEGARMEMELGGSTAQSGEAADGSHGAERWVLCVGGWVGVGLYRGQEDGKGVGLHGGGGGARIERGLGGGAA